MRKSGIKDYFTYFVPAVVVSLVGFAIAYPLVDPAPPRHVTIATGQPTGAYFEMGRNYSRILAREGITLEVKPTSGSFENLKLIADKNSGVDVIFKQGGVGNSDPSDDLVSLGAIFYEPLWVFYRSELQVVCLTDLKGKRISIGIEGSGTKVLAQDILALNGVTKENSQFMLLKGTEAEAKLLAGQIDAAFVMVAYREQAGRKLMNSPDVKLFNFRRAEAYTTRFNFLSSLKIPEGTVNLEKNIPKEDTHLVAPLAQLVVHKDFHPALIDLFLEAAEEVGSPSGVFKEPVKLPSPSFVDFPLSNDAKRYYKHGPPFLQRFLPFWIANFIDRMKILLLPFLALLFPLVKLLPPFYQWRIRSRIFRWYDQLIEIDFEILNEKIAHREDEFISRLNRLDQQLSQVSVPGGYYRELYDMRLHIDLLRQKLLAAVADKH